MKKTTSNWLSQIVHQESSNWDLLNSLILPKSTRVTTDHNRTSIKAWHNTAKQLRTLEIRASKSGEEYHKVWKELLLYIYIGAKKKKKIL